MLILSLVRKDLLRAYADRRALIVNLALPLLLTAIMGFSFGGGQGAGLSTIPIMLVGSDLPDGVRDRLGAGLQESGWFTVVWADSAAADAAVRRGDAAAAVVFPPAVFTRLIDGREITLEVWKDPGSPLKSGIVEEILGRLLRPYQAGEAAYAALWPADRAGARADDAFTAEEYFSGGINDIWKRFRNVDQDPVLQEAQGRFMTVMDHQVALSDALAVERVGLAVHDKAPAGNAAATGEVNLFDYFLPSFAVFFLMFAVSAAARDIHRERARLTLQRQLLTPMRGFHFVVAKWIGAVLQGLVQLLVLFVAGALLFRVNLGPDPFALPVIALLTCTAGAGVFLLLALVTPTEKVMDNLATVVILVSAMIGGNFVPVESLPAWVPTFGRFVFNYWANLGFTEVVVRNGSLPAITGPVLVLASLTVTLFAVNVGLFVFRARRGGLA